MAAVDVLRGGHQLFLELRHADAKVADLIIEFADAVRVLLGGCLQRGDIALLVVEL